MTTALRIENLVKEFGSLRATNDVSFDVDEGRSIALVGPNGAGKTTIFSQVMGEFPPTSGQISFYGEDITGLTTSKRINKGVSRTYQVPRPFGDLDILSNIRVGLLEDSIWGMIAHKPDREEEEAIALSVGFSPEDFEKTPAELSMGDLRKLEMARTLATKPRMMLLDEVFAGLSHTEIEQISALIQKLRSDGMTFLIVSHDMGALEPLVDAAIAVERGTIIAEGPLLQVLEDGAVRAAYLGET